jgi:hypothetical protein
MSAAVMSPARSKGVVSGTGTPSSAASDMKVFLELMACTARNQPGSGRALCSSAPKKNTDSS